MTFPVGTTTWDDSPAFPGATLNIVSNGDSISLTSLVQRNYLPRLAALIAANGNGTPQWKRNGINGASWNFAWSGSGYAFTLTQDALLRVDVAKSATLPNWLILFAGTNGFALNGATAANEYNDFKTYIAARLAAGWAASQVIVCTMLPRTGISEVTRAAYNTLLVAGAVTYGYQVARLDLNASIGAAGQNTNLTWFIDGTHPTDAGHAIIAQTIYALMFPAVTAVVTASGGFLLPMGRKKTQQERYEERKRYGIEIPKAAAKVIARVADAQITEPAPDLDAALRKALERRDIAYKALYAELLRQEVQRREDEEYALILLMH